MPGAANSNPTQLVIAALLANPLLTGKQISKLTGVSQTTISKINQRLKKGIQQNDSVKAAYGMLASEQIPAETRVDRLRSLIDHADRDATSLQAIQYVDQITGVAPVKQVNKEDTHEHKPMFVLPSATNVTVNINAPPKPEDDMVLGLRPINHDANHR